jgi:uncharacterized protein (TIGR03437 family)
MPASAIAALALLAGSASTAQVTRDPPSYSVASIVNAASNDASALAPYTIITINGTNLAWTPYAMQASDVRNGTVPVVLPNAGVRVWIAGEAAGLLSVSPTQLTVLVPGDLIAGPIPIQTMLDGLVGPELTVNLTAAAPGIFSEDTQTLLASRPDGTPVSSDAPLSPGDQFVLHATGLGMSDPPINPLQIPDNALPLSPAMVMMVYLNDAPLDPSAVLNVSFVPGQAGMFQMLLQLPPNAPSNPELRLDVNGHKSAPGYHLRVLSQ